MNSPMATPNIALPKFKQKIKKTCVYNFQIIFISSFIQILKPFGIPLIDY